MPKLSLLKQDGTNAGEITLNDTVFGIEPNEKVVVDVILSQRASLRQGTHKVKIVQKYVVADVNHGVKKVQVVPVKVQSVPAMAWRWCRIRPNTSFICLQIT